MLQFYTDEMSSLNWTEASRQAAKGAGKGEGYARKLQGWAQYYIGNQEILPIPQYHHAKALIIEHEDQVAHEVHYTKLSIVT